MHIIGGLLLLVIVFVGVYFFLQSGVFQPAGDLFVTLFGVNGTSTISSSTVPANASAAYGKVRVSFVSLGGGDERSPMRLALTAYLGPNEGLNVTGWKVVTNRGTYELPRTVNSY